MPIPVSQTRNSTPSPWAEAETATVVREDGTLSIARSYRPDEWIRWFEAAKCAVPRIKGPIFDSSITMAQAAMQGTGVGLLPAENLIGRAEIVLASWKPGAGLTRPKTWLNLQTDRFLKPIR